MTNILDWAEQIRSTGVVRAGYGNVANTMIDLDDIAAVAARVLVEDGHIGKKYTLSGPEAIRRVDIVRQIGEAIGRELRFEELTHEQAIEALTPKAGEFAEWYVDGLAQMARTPANPRSSMAEALHRPPGDDHRPVGHQARGGVPLNFEF